MKSDDSTFGYVSVNALMEFARNHVDGKVDCNDIARFPRSNVRNADEQQSLQQIFGISYARLRELAEAEREGRVVVLPKCNTCVYNDGDGRICYECIGRTIDFQVLKHKPNAESARSLSSANEHADRCSTCENNGKPICSGCIMTGHGNDIDFYRAATEPKGEATT